MSYLGFAGVWLLIVLSMALCGRLRTEMRLRVAAEDRAAELAEAERQRARKRGERHA